MAYTVTFWGTRGSIPTPGAHTARYGGNTSCVAVSGATDQLVILDAGSGIRPLGRELSRIASGPMNLDILLSHTHWDHIQGLPFFQPLNTKGNAVRIYGAAQAGVPLEEILDRQMDPVVFPVPLKALAAELTITEVSQWVLRDRRVPRGGVPAAASRHDAGLPAGAGEGRARPSPT